MKKLTYLLAIVNFSLYSMQSLQDDINSPTCWVNNPSNLAPVTLPDLSNPNLFTINQRHFYRPVNIPDVKDLIVCAFIHDQALEHNNNYQEHFAHVKRFATWYATIKHKNLELLSCQYTQPWSDNKQVKAGEQLQNILMQYYPDAETVLFGHSNGANISNYVSRITPAEKPIDLMVHLSCPRKHRDNYQPLHYKNLLYFFSDNDGAGAPAISLIEYYTKNKDETWSHYFTGRNTDLLIEGAHDFFTLPKKISIGFRTKIDSIDPIDTINVSSFLPEIIEKTLTDYPYCYTQNDCFTININTQQTNKPLLHLALRFKLLTPKLHNSYKNFPLTTDYLVRNNNMNNIIIGKAISREQHELEVENSKQEEARYTTDYGKYLNAPNILDESKTPRRFNIIFKGTLVTLFIAILYKFFFKKQQPTTSENDKDNDDESSTEPLTAAEIFNTLLATQPL